MVLLLHLVWVFLVPIFQNLNSTMVLLLPEGSLSLLPTVSRFKFHYGATSTEVDINNLNLSYLHLNSTMVLLLLKADLQELKIKLI